MDAEDLHQRRDREANAAYGNHRHDAVANPPSPRVSVVDIGDGADAGRESHEANDCSHRHDRQQRLVPPGKPDAPVHACSPSWPWRRMRRRTIQFSAPNIAYNTANTGAVMRSHLCVRSGIGVFGRPVMYPIWSNGTEERCSTLVPP